MRNEHRIPFLYVVAALASVMLPMWLIWSATSDLLLTLFVGTAAALFCGVVTNLITINLKGENDDEQ